MTPRMHLIAVGIILLVSLLGLFASGKLSFGPQQEQAAADPGQFLITVSATWGENCNDYIKNNNDNPRRDEKNIIISEQIPPVKKDNVLRRVAAMCDTRAACAFPVKQDILGPDPAPGCTKALVIDYRCGELGVTERITAYSGNQLALDCNSPSSVKQ